MKTGKKQARKNLKHLIAGLQSLYEDGAGATQVEVNNEIRDARPEDKNWSDKHYTIGLKQLNPTGYKNIHIDIEIFDPKSI